MTPKELGQITQALPRNLATTSSGPSGQGISRDGVRENLQRQFQTVKTNYALHVSYKWWDYKNRSHQKNQIFQRELSRAITHLTTAEPAELVAVRTILTHAKTNLEQIYGTRSWSWCLLRTQYSSRLLEELIRNLNQLIPQETPLLVSTPALGMD